jgi:hypothetical protein
MADLRRITLDRAPNLAVLLARPAATSDGRGGRFRDVEMRRPRARIERERLVCAGVCGTRAIGLPASTYPHVLLFPMQVALTADRSFELGLGGLIHVGSRISALRPIHADEALAQLDRRGVVSSPDGRERSISWVRCASARRCGRV